MKITGQIFDENSNSLPGVIVGSSAFPSINTFTDEKGNFLLENDKITNISPIRISYVGYKDEFPLAKNLTNAKIQLKIDSTPLKNVVVYTNPKDKTTDLEPTPSVQNLLSKYKTPITIVSVIIIMGTGYFLIQKAIK